MLEKHRLAVPLGPTMVVISGRGIEVDAVEHLLPPEALRDRAPRSHSPTRSRLPLLCALVSVRRANLRAESKSENSPTRESERSRAPPLRWWRGSPRSPSVARCIPCSSKPTSRPRRKPAPCTACHDVVAAHIRRDSIEVRARRSAHQADADQVAADDSDHVENRRSAAEK